MTALHHQLHKQRNTLHTLLLLPVRRSTDPSWLRSHPSTAERIRRLNALAADTSRPMLESSAPISIASQYRIISRPEHWHGFGVWY